MKVNIKTSLNLIAMTTVLTVFPGCGVIDYLKDKISGKKSTPTSETSFIGDVTGIGPVVMYIDGKPALNKSEFEDRVNQFVSQQFQGAITADNLPPAYKKMIAEKVIEQEVVLAWEKMHNVESNPEFIKAFNEVAKMLKAQLMFREFEKEIVGSIQVSESEVKNDYEKNREKYVKTAGGTVAYGVRFDNEAVAAQFKEKMAGSLEKFEEEAKQAKNGMFKAFGRVSVGAPNRDIPQAVKDAIVSYKGTYPTIISVKENEHVWDVYLSDHKDTELYAFDEIKSQIEGMLKGQKAQEAYTVKIGEIKQKLGVTVNEDALGINVAALDKAEGEENSEHMALGDDVEDVVEDGSSAPVVA